MSCNCEGKTYNLSFGCCEPVLAPIENYYTKYQVNKLIESATTSGCCITPEEVDEKIASAQTDTQEWVIDQHYITGVDLSNYALKEEIPDISGYATEQWVNDQGFLKNHQSLEGYATENWVQNQGYLTEHQPIKTINNQSLIGEGNIDIGTGGTIDLSNYYTTAQTVNLVESAVTRVEGEIPSLSGYATEQWVLDKHYITGVNLSDYVTYEDMAEYVGDVYTKQEVNNLFVTKATFNTYITNLQQQIDSLKETISACCSSTGETEYRWIVKPNDYTCSGTTKMTKEIQQSSTDGFNWTDTGQYRTGSTVLEYDSTDCGFVPSSNFKVRANYNRGYTVGSGQVECNSSTTLSQEEVKSITFATYFTSIEFGDCIDTIGEDAFVNVRTISSVTIPSNITTLKSCAFNNCGIQNYVLNNGLTTIEHTAFINNYNLSAITIPSTVTSIGSQAFFNCTALTTVTINATTPPAVSSSSIDEIFNNCSSLTTIYVPASSVDTYKAADGWSLYADLIRAIQ